MEKKKRIYMNYKRQNKWMGIIEYRTLFIIVIYCIIIFLILNSLNLSLKLFIYTFCFLLFPVIVLVLFNSKNYSILTLIFIILKFLRNKKYFVDLRYFKKLKDEKYIK